LWVIERLSPATKVVEAPPAPSRHPVVRQRRERCRKDSVCREWSTTRQMNSKNEC
jgi:hypothetical protein